MSCKSNGAFNGAINGNGHDHSTESAPCSTAKALVEAQSRAADMQLQAVDMRNALVKCNDILRSCCEVARRHGEQTNWEALRANLHEVIEAQAKLLYPTITPDHPILSRTARTFKLPDQATMD